LRKKISKVISLVAREKNLKRSLEIGDCLVELKILGEGLSGETREEDNSL
jgi:hypothetical protein